MIIIRFQQRHLCRLSIARVFILLHLDSASLTVTLQPVKVVEVSSDLTIVLLGCKGRSDSKISKPKSQAPVAQG